VRGLIPRAEIEKIQTVTQGSHSSDVSPLTHCNTIAYFYAEINKNTIELVL